MYIYPSIYLLSVWSSYPPCVVACDSLPCACNKLFPLAIKTPASRMKVQRRCDLYFGGSDFAFAEPFLLLVTFSGFFANDTLPFLLGKFADPSLLPLFFAFAGDVFPTLRNLPLLCQLRTKIRRKLAFQSSPTKDITVHAR